MTKFPFIVGPKNEPKMEKIGSEEAGYIEIIRRGYLTVGEQSTVQQAIASDNSAQQMLGLVRRCSHQFNMDVEEAYRSVMSAMGGSSEGDYVKEIYEKYGNELDDIATSMAASQTHQTLVKAYVMISFRVSQDVEFADLGDFHPELILALNELYDAEERKSLDRLAYAISEKKEDKEDANAENLELAQKKPSKTAKQA